MRYKGTQGTFTICKSGNPYTVNIDTKSKRLRGHEPLALTVETLRKIIRDVKAGLF